MINFYDYHNHVLDGPWQEYFHRYSLTGNIYGLDHIVMKDPREAYTYIINRMDKKRWERAESYIKRDPKYAFLYAANILKRRWLEAEPFIKKDQYYYGCYKACLC